MQHFPSPSPLLSRPLTPGDAAAQRLWPTRGQVLFGAMLANLAFLLLLLREARLHIDWLGAGAVPYYLACATAAAARFGLPRLHRDWARRVAHAAEYFVVFMLIGLLGAVGSYPISALTRGFHDPALQAIDTFLHFDWLAWYEATAAHPALQVGGRIAYELIYYTPALILGYLAWTERRREAHTMLATFWVAAAITLAMFWFMPAVGPFAYLWHGPIPYMPASQLWQPELIPALRHGAMPVIDLGSLRGLVSAPSFHTAAAVLYVAIAWPYRAIRWPVLVADVAMLASTPVEGTHYLADMIAGGAVALCSLALIAWIERLPFARAAVPAGLRGQMRRA